MINLNWMRKEAVEAYFKVLPQYLPGGAQESHRNLGEYSMLPDGDMLLTEPKEALVFCIFFVEITLIAINEMEK